jgi:isocitrate/isopropylmalate dehydrogenase
MHALGTVLLAGAVRTRDLGGTASTMQFADAVCEALDKAQGSHFKVVRLET